MGFYDYDVNSHPVFKEGERQFIFDNDDLDNPVKNNPDYDT